jgi:hypothetical protein
MPLSVERRSRKSIVSQYRGAAAVPRFCSENDPRCRRVTWSDVREMSKELGEGPSLKLERQVAQTIWLMMIKLEIEIQGEILQVRDNYSNTAWSQVYPGRVFRTQDVPFTYDELRGMGNGTHLVKPRKPLAKMEEGSPRTGDEP